MKLRTLLRDEKKQLELEKKGAVVIPFLIPDNIAWILEKKKEINPWPKDDVSLFRIHEALNEKLQSKVEYRCINCSPFCISVNLLEQEMVRNFPFFLQDSVTNENRSTSMHLIAPLFTATDRYLTLRYLRGAHLLSIPARGKGIPAYYANDPGFVAENFSRLRIRSGEAALFFDTVPYSFLNDELSEAVPLLEISVLPYEARPNIYEASSDGAETVLQGYEPGVEAYIEYKAGKDEALLKMRKLRKLPFMPSFLTDKEKESLALKKSLKSLVFGSKLFSKIFAP